MNFYLLIHTYTGENRAWNVFVKTKIKKWQYYFMGWLIGGKGHPVLVVRYEDLKTDSFSQVKRMLEFLKVPYSEEELEKRMMQDVKIFHRKHQDTFQHFTPGQRAIVLSSIEMIIQLLKSKRMDTMHLEEYLQSTTI